MTRFCAKSFVINLQLTLGPPPLSLQLHTLTGCQQALQRETERQRERDTQRKNSSLQSSSKPFLFPVPPPPPPHSPDVSLTSRLFTTLESKPCPLVLHIHSLPPARSSTKQKKNPPSASGPLHRSGDTWPVTKETAITTHRTKRVC